jgi:hypothetical protein
MAFYDILGTAGVGFIVVMYIMLQTGRIDPGRMAFSLYNAVGSVLILVSLAYEFNFSAVLIEGTWLLVSLYGLWRAWQKRRFSASPGRSPHSLAPYPDRERRGGSKNQ